MAGLLSCRYGRAGTVPICTVDPHVPIEIARLREPARDNRKRGVSDAFAPPRSDSARRPNGMRTAELFRRKCHTCLGNVNNGVKSIVTIFQRYLKRQSLHWYGFSPLCIRKCFVSVELSEKAFLHARHLSSWKKEK